MCHTLICNHSQKWYQISPCIIHILMVKLISPHLNFLPLASSTSVTTYGTNREAGNFSSPRVETCTYVKWGILWKQMKSSKGSRVFSFNYKTIGTSQFDLQRKCSKLLQSWRLANLEELQLSRSKKTPQKPLKTPVFNTLPAHAETYASLKKCQRTTPIHLLIEAASNENQTGKKWINLWVWSNQSQSGFHMWKLLAACMMFHQIHAKLSRSCRQIAWLLFWEACYIQWFLWGKAGRSRSHPQKHKDQETDKAAKWSDYAPFGNWSFATSGAGQA